MKQKLLNCIQIKYILCIDNKLKCLRTMSTSKYNIGNSRMYEGKNREISFCILSIQYENIVVIIIKYISVKS